MNRQVSNSKVKEANKALHDIEAQYYDLLHSEIWNFYEQWQTKQDIENIAKLLGRKPLSVLDVGCGTGNLTLKFLERGYRVIALDISEKMLEVLRDKIPEALKGDVEFVCEDIDKLLLLTNKLYDVICFSSVLHHLPDYFYTLEMAASRLREGGIIYIVHEPLPLQSGSIQNYRKRLLSLADGYLNHWRLARQAKNLKLPTLNYFTSDIHSKEGLNLQQVSAFLNNRDLDIISYRKYANYKSGIICFLGNLLFDAKEFKIIARRREANSSEK